MEEEFSLIELFGPLTEHLLFIKASGVILPLISLPFLDTQYNIHVYSNGACQ